MLVPSGTSLPDAMRMRVGCPFHGPPETPLPPTTGPCIRITSWVGAWLLRARAHVAMGSLDSAARALRSAKDSITASSTTAASSTNAASTTAAAKDSNTAAASTTTAHGTLVKAVEAESGRLDQIILTADAIASGLRLFYPRAVPMPAPTAGSNQHDGAYRTRSHTPTGAPTGGAAVSIGYRIWKAPARVEAPARGRSARGVLLYFHVRATI